MKIIKVDLTQDISEAVVEAVRVLSSGGVVVYPTDTVYGLGANACDEWAVEKIFKIKKRPLSKPVPILARNIKWVNELVFLPPKLEKALAQMWPGPITVILPRRKVIPGVVTAGLQNVGVRISALLLVDKILAKFGYPITATPASISGEDSAGDINRIIESFRDEIWKPDL